MSIPENKLVPMYRLMVLIRKFEEKAVQLFLNADIPGFLHSSIGQEAIPVAISACLRDNDYVASTH